MTEGHNHVRSIFERWRRLEDAKREIADDLKDLFSEAKSHGFDTKALRAAFRQVVKDEERSAADNEHDALVDTYMAAIQGHARPAHARVEIVEEIPPHDAETGELLDEAAGEAQEVERRFRTPEDAGSIPAASSNAVVAQQVEQPICDRTVAGSIPASGPNFEEPDLRAFLDRRGRP